MSLEQSEEQKLKGQVNLVYKVFGEPSLDLEVFLTSPYRRTELDSAMSIALAKLPPRERRVLEIGYQLDGGEALTLSQMGLEIPKVRGSGNVGGERVRQMKAKAQRMLRHPIRSTELVALLPDNNPFKKGRQIRELERAINSLQKNWQRFYDKNSWDNFILNNFLNMPIDPARDLLQDQLNPLPLINPT